MNHFASFHARLQEKADQASARPVLYVAIGDSVTQGCMEDGVIEHKQVYHRLFAERVVERYPTTVLNVINAGVSGQTAVQSRTRWQRDVIDYKPDLVTIGFGLNDAHAGEQGLDAYIGAIRDLVQLVKDHTDADLLVLTPGMMMNRDNEWISAGHRGHIPTFLQTYEAGHLRRYAAALRDFAREQQLPCLDLYRMWEAMEQNGVDIHERLSNGINHPDRPFHHVMAEAMERIVFETI